MSIKCSLKKTGKIYQTLIVLRSYRLGSLNLLLIASDDDIVRR